jgi:hypothetical protein
MNARKAGGLCSGWQRNGKVRFKLSGRDAS